MKTPNKHRLWPMLLLFMALPACRQPSGPTEHAFSGATMGTFYQVTLIADKPVLDPAALQAGIEERLETVNRLMSNWREQSDVSRFNRLTPTETLTVDPHTATVVRRALELAEQTHGALDPTLGPLIELWGFGTAKQEFPSEAAISKTLDQTGYRHLILENNRLGKRKQGLALNLSSLAKGYAVDLVYTYLKAQGFQDFLVNVGGDGRVAGRNGRGGPWRMAIEAPDSAQLQGIYTVTEISDVAMATSGDYRIFFESDGVRYSHLIDPRSGRPIPARITSVSVIAPDCMTADGLATALSILAPEEGLALVESLPGVECLLLLRDQDDGLSELKSSGMAAYLAGDL